MNLDAVLARLLEVGTWLAAVLIASGLFLSRTHVVVAGIGVLIALPTLRVAVMLGTFLARRDRWGIAIAALVLSIIALGIVLGVAG